MVVHPHLVFPPVLNILQETLDFQLITSSDLTLQKKTYTKKKSPPSLTMVFSGNKPDPAWSISQNFGLGSGAMRFRSLLAFGPSVSQTILPTVFVRIRQRRGE